MGSFKAEEARSLFLCTLVYVTVFTSLPPHVRRNTGNKPFEGGLRSSERDDLSRDFALAPFPIYMYICPYLLHSRLYSLACEQAAPPYRYGSCSGPQVRHINIYGQG